MKCESCKTPIINPRPKQRYCSRSCKERAKNARRRSARVCKRCGESYRQPGKYCSAECRNWKPPRPDACKKCGKPLNHNRSKGRVRFTCAECGHNRERVGFKCWTCGGRVFSDARTNYCSPDCRLRGAVNRMAKTRYRQMLRRLRETHKPRYKMYKGIECRISQYEFIEWAKVEIYKFKQLYPYDIPSVDRIDPDGHYEFGNIRIISLAHNSLRSRYFTHTLGLDARNSRDKNIHMMARAFRVWSEEFNLTKEQVIEAWS
jgi:hypothetical protein